MTAHLDLDLLKTFLAIADTGSITRAANDVGRTQSAISMQVRRIEEVVEGPVLLRTPRGVELTARGQRLLAHARRLVKAHDEALVDVTGRGLTGAIRIGCPEDYCTAFLPALLRAIAREHPRVSLNVACAPTPMLRRMLDEKRIDLALVSLAADDDSEAAVRREPLAWVAAHDFAPFDDEPLQVALSDPQTLDHRAARLALDSVGRPYRVAYESVSKDGLLAIVRAGIAIAVLTRGAVPPDLRVLEPGAALPALPSVGIAVASAGGDGDSLLVADVKKLMSETLGRLPGAD
jgi:DNA-binding transcriptional LysR family regulator